MKTRKILSLALALVMALALMPTAALASDDGENWLTTAWSRKGEGWSWNHETQTLTLDGYEGDGFEVYLAKEYNGMTSIDFNTGDLTIELAAGSSNYVHSQLLARNVVVRGGGSLVVESEGGSAIDCESFKMESGTVKLKGGINFDFMLEDSSSVEILGGTLTTYTSLHANKVSVINASVTLMDGHGIWAKTDLTLRNCSLTARGNGEVLDPPYLFSGEKVTMDNLKLYCSDWYDWGYVCGSVESEPTIYNMPEDSYELDYCPEAAHSPWTVYLTPIGDPIAYPSTQKVDVDGKAIEFQCYALKDANGNDTNYIKLRDLADILNGSAVQFEVGWNGNVTITTGKGYTKNGSEQSTPFSGQRTYQEVTAPTLVNGEARDLAAFVLNDDQGGGYTYYQLRDLGKALGFNVGWAADKGIFVETDKPYDANN